MSYKGVAFANEAAPLVKAYYDRLELAKLGYTEDVSSLDSYTADCFLFISRCFSEVRKEEAKKHGKRNPRASR